MLILVRSIVFNILFYLNTLILLIMALPTFFLPYRAIIWVAKTWGRINLVLLRVVAGIKIEVRGREKIPRGAILVAAKHQSAWETFALLPLFDNPVFIVKRELQWIPIFGWLMIKGRMVPVDRSAGSQALAEMTERARIELADNRQLIIFPEGTRRAAGAEPDLDWAMLARANQTVVIYMGLSKAAIIAERLIGAGRAADTPALIVENASLPAERRIVSRLGELAAAAAGLDGPAMLMIGESMAVARAEPACADILGGLLVEGAAS